MIKKENLDLLQLYANEFGISRADKQKITFCRRFVEFINEHNVSIKELTPIHISTYIKHLFDKIGNKETTIRTKIFTIKTFYTFLEENYHCNIRTNRIFTKKIRKSLEKTKPGKRKEYSYGDIMRVINSMKLKWKAVSLVLLETGARLKFIRDLQVDDVNLEENYIYVYESKNNSERYIPLTDETSTVLYDYYHSIRPQPKSQYKHLFFITNNGNPFAMDYYMLKLKRQSIKVLGYNRFMTSKVFRGFFATSLIDSGASTKQIQEAGGWQSSKSIEFYRMNRPNRTKEILQKGHQRHREQKLREDKRMIAESKKEIEKGKEVLHDVLKYLEKTQI